MSVKLCCNKKINIISFQNPCLTPQVQKTHLSNILQTEAVLTWPSRKQDFLLATAVGLGLGLRLRLRLRRWSSASTPTLLFF